MLKHIELLIESLETFFWSGGGEPREEILWGANDLLKWIENEFNIELNIRFKQDDETFEYNYDEVIKILKEKLN